MPRGKKSARYVPYIKGFRRPTGRQQEKALLKKDESLTGLPQEYQPDASIFPPLPRCTSLDDWLAQYKEGGQTYSDYLSQCPWLSSRKWKSVKQEFNPLGKNLPEKYPKGVIYILPLGEFDGRTSPDLDELINYTQVFYGLPVQKLPGLKLEVTTKDIYWVYEKKLPDGTVVTCKELLKSRHKSGHHQLRVDSGLLRLRMSLPDDALCVIALTMSDLYEANPDLFVAGMASGNQRSAIFSFFRYDPALSFSQENWYDVRRKKNQNAMERSHLLLLRSCRLLVHELGHLLGLAHCIYYSCCMNGSGHLTEDFRQPMFLCPVDLRKVVTLCGVNVLARYKAMKQFSDEHHWTEEGEWLQKRIDSLCKQGN